MNFAVYIEKGEDFGFVAHCPSLPGCHSQGDSIRDAIENIRDAILGWLDVLSDDSNVPRPGALEVHVAN